MNPTTAEHARIILQGAKDAGATDAQLLAYQLTSADCIGLGEDVDAVQRAVTELASDYTSKE